MEGDWTTASLLEAVSSSAALQGHREICAQRPQLLGCVMCSLSSE